MLGLASAAASLVVAFVTLVVLRLINNHQVIHFSNGLFITTLIIIYTGIMAVSNNWHDIVIICLPIIILASCEKFTSTYLTRFVNNDRVSIIKMFITLGYFTGLIIAKYLLC